MVTKTKYMREIVETVEYKYDDDLSMDNHMKTMEDHGWDLGFVYTDKRIEYVKRESL